METIIAGVTDVTTMVGNVFTVMTGNPLLVFYLAAGLVGTGIGLFARLKHTAK